jgi:N-acetylglucosaminyldiphosphoundecaprenol N-acetyl-beta-D-mannosaminyltransferase
MRYIYFVDEVPDIQVLLGQAKISKRSFGIHFVNSYSLACIAIGLIPQRNLENNFNIIDGKPLQKYLEINLGKNILHNRGVDFLRKNMRFLADQKVQQTFLSFDPSSEKSLIQFCLNEQIDSSAMKFLTLDEKFKVSKIPYLENPKIPEQSVVWIFAGTPKQDQIARSLESRSGLVTVGAGGALDMLTGKTVEAPRYLRQMYLEWLYRLIQEPKRLWKRYTFGNIAFIILITYDFLSTLLNLKSTKSQNQTSLSLPDIFFRAD